MWPFSHTTDNTGCPVIIPVVSDVEVDSLVQGLLSVVLNGHSAGLKSSSSIVPVGQGK